MRNYWRDTYGKRSNEFIEGVIAGVETYAVYKDGQRLVGVMEQPLNEVIQEIKEGMGLMGEITSCCPVRKQPNVSA